MDKRQDDTQSTVEMASMRRELRLKYNVPDDQIDEIIAIALELKANEADGDIADLAGVSTIHDGNVTTLDYPAEPAEPVEDEDTEAAAWRTKPPTVTAIDLDRAAAIQDGRLAAHHAQQSKAAGREAAARSVGKALLWGVFLTLCMLAIGGVAAMSLAIGPVVDAQEKAGRVETRLEAILISQANLSGTLVALGGPESLTEQAKAVQQARPGPERLRASDALWVGMATALGDLPVPRTYADIMAQSELEQDLAESHMAFAPERERYDELLAEWERGTQDDWVRWAIRLGLTEAPPR